MIARWCAALVLVGSALLGTPATAANANDSVPTVVAHRTAMNYAPENTVAGINKAADMGATWVEMDVRWIASNYPWLMHDSDVARTTNGTGAVSSLYYGAMQKLNAADFAPWNDVTKYPQYKFVVTNNISNIRPPYAYEFLYATAHRNMNAILHIQTTPTKAQADMLVNYLHRAEFGDLEARSVYMASAASIQAFRSFEPNEPIKYMMIDYPTDGGMRTAEYLKSIGASGYVVPFDASIDKSFVDYYHENDLTVFSWTSIDGLDIKSSWKSLANAGVDATISNAFDKVSDCYADLTSC
jgi:glycerophosphoryl diester phosphodiesterase